MERRWFDSHQPQTLQIAVVLLYTNSVLLLLQALFTGGFGLFLLVFIVGQVGGALGIANEKKIGYWVAVAFALLPVALTAYLVARYHVFAVSIFQAIFEIALIVALFHPMSRSYKKIWFR